MSQLPPDPTRRLQRGAAWALVVTLGLSAGCVGPAQRYPLRTPTDSPTDGSLQVERIEGGQRLVVLELRRLPPPEQLGPGLTTYAVWLQADGADPQLVGTLRYDRARRSGNLMATTPLRTFTLRITGERQARPDGPSPLLIAERRVIIN